MGGREQGIKQAKLTHYSINASSQEIDLICFAPFYTKV